MLIYGPEIVVFSKYGENTAKLSACPDVSLRIGAHVHVGERGGHFRVSCNSMNGQGKHTHVFTSHMVVIVHPRSQETCLQPM